MPVIQICGAGRITRQAGRGRGCKIKCHNSGGKGARALERDAGRCAVALNKIFQNREDPGGGVDDNLNNL